MPMTSYYRPRISGCTKLYALRMQCVDFESGFHDFPKRYAIDTGLTTAEYQAGWQYAEQRAQAPRQVEQEGLR